MASAAQEAEILGLGLELRAGAWKMDKGKREVRKEDETGILLRFGT